MQRLLDELLASAQRIAAAARCAASGADAVWPPQVVVGHSSTWTSRSGDTASARWCWHSDGATDSERGATGRHSTLGHLTVASVLLGAIKHDDEHANDLRNPGGV